MLPKLQFGMFDNFKGARTLLLWGDTSGIATLQEIFRDLSSGARNVADLHEIEWAEGRPHTGLILQRVKTTPEVAMNLHETAGTTSIVWKATREEFGLYSELIAPLGDTSCTAGHQYLGTDQNFPIQVIVSTGEYPDDFQCGGPSLSNAGASETR